MLLHLKCLIGIILVLNEPCLDIKKRTEVRLTGDNYTFNESVDYWLNIENQKALKITEVEYKDNNLCRLRVFKPEVILEYGVDDLQQDSALIVYYNVQIQPECINSEYFDTVDMSSVKVLKVNEAERIIIAEPNDQKRSDIRLVYHY